MKSTLPAEVIETITNGTHGDPFSVLGLHHAEIEGNEKLLLRVYRPDAKSVAVKIGKGKPTDLERTDPDGLFEYVFPRRKNKAPYTLLITPHVGEEFSTPDPYSFDSMISDFDLQLWGEGKHKNAYHFMGAHIREVDGVSGTHFVVSAPSATRVSVVGSFNNWDGRIHRMRKHHDQGLFELFIPHVGKEDFYK